MSENLKKTFATALRAVFLAAVSCAGSRVGLPNPVKPSNPQEIMRTLGLEFVVPEGARNVRYAVIAKKTAQMDFELDGADCTARIAPSAEFSDISGMHYRWEAEEDCKIGWCTGRTMLAKSDGKSVGVCLWFDAAPGLMYSLSMVGKADADALKAVAARVYRPVQGEAGILPSRRARRLSAVSRGTPISLCSGGRLGV